jgi:hypothetical protein
MGLHVKRAPYDPPHELVGQRCQVNHGFLDGVVIDVIEDRGLILVRHDDGLKALWKPSDVRILSA